MSDILLRLASLLLWRSSSIPLDGSCCFSFRSFFLVALWLSDLITTDLASSNSRTEGGCDWQISIVVVPFSTTFVTFDKESNSAVWLLNEGVYDDRALKLLRVKVF